MGVRWATSIRLAYRLAPAASEDAESHVTHKKNQQDVIATDWEHIQQDVIATDELISHRIYSAPVRLTQRPTEACAQSDSIVEFDPKQKIILKRPQSSYPVIERAHVNQRDMSPESICQTQPQQSHPFRGPLPRTHGATCNIRVFAQELGN